MRRLWALFVVACLPMPLDKAAQLMMRAAYSAGDATEIFVSTKAY
jgi:hypothetical protein